MSRQNQIHVNPAVATEVERTNKARAETGASMSSQMMRAALAYGARYGWPTVPLHHLLTSGACSCGDTECGNSRGKHPRTEHGLRDATLEATKIREFWRKWPEANIGVLTGSASDLLVLDVDGEDGFKTLETLISQHGHLPETLVSSTGKGQHIFFRLPEGLRIQSSVRRLGIGLDVRGEGAYVVVPPSKHFSGTRYEWKTRTKPAPTPQWLIDALTSFSQKVRSNRTTGIPAGQRNATLAGIAGAMRRQDASQEAIEAALLAENSARCDPPLSEGEVLKITRSISRYPASLARRASGKESATTSAIMRRASEIEPKAVRWLWPDRIPLGKLILFAGDPDEGKTVVAIDIAARVTQGGKWPDGGLAETGSVIIMSAEDDLEDTLVPRLIAAGADRSLVHFLEASRRVAADGKEVKQAVTLADIDAIENALSQVVEAKLVIVDPVSAYLSDADSHKNAEVRALLSPLAKLAARRGVAILLITHLSKSGGSALYRAIGSIGFIAAARASWFFGRDKNDPERRLMLRMKGNLAADIGGLAYNLEGVMVLLKDDEQSSSVKVKWEQGLVNLSADEILAAESAGEHNKRAEAMGWLKAALEAGPRPSEELIAKATGVGIAKKTLRRAKDELGVKAEKLGFGRGWQWALPTDKGAQKNPEDGHTPESGHLRASDGKHTQLVQQDARRRPPAGEEATFGDDGSLRDADETEVEL